MQQFLPTTPELTKTPIKNIKFKEYSDYEKPSCQYIKKKRNWKSNSQVLEFLLITLRQKCPCLYKEFLKTFKSKKTISIILFFISLGNSLKEMTPEYDLHLIDLC